jgi:hypothetical protein
MSKELYMTMVPTPNRKSMNTGLSAAKVSTMTSIFGAFPSLPTNCQGGNKNKRIAAMLETRSVGPFRATGITPALNSLARIFARVKEAHPDLYKIVKSEGMNCYRCVRGAPGTPSNHSSATAIDLSIGGFLPEMDSTPESPKYIPTGYVILYGYFHREGWFWAAGYRSRADAMHFEVADETLRAWDKQGLI